MYLGIDIGGTKTLIAVFSKHGRIIRKLKIKTAWKKDRFLKELEKSLTDFTKYKIKAVAVAIPGTVQKNYTVSFGNRDWGKFNLLDTLKNLFDCPIVFENDANIAAIYESSRLKGKTIFLTFSTGIGGGIAEHGVLLPESKKFEPGHVKYVYNEKQDEWEDIAAASVLGRVYHVDVATDLRGKKVMQDVARRVYLGLPDIIKKYNPDTIILGGPLGKIFSLYVKYLPKTDGVKYRRPKRPLESVIYGCYILAKSAK